MKLKFYYNGVWNLKVGNHVWAQFSENLVFNDKGFHRLNKWGIRHFI